MSPNIISICLLTLALANALSVSMIPKTGTPPSFREVPGFTLDPSRSKLFVYGGRYTSILDDMWEYDIESQTWSEIYVTSSLNPGPRSDPYLASLDEDRLMLFGGNTKSGPASDLWEFDIDNYYVRSIQWRLVNTNGKAPPRTFNRSVLSYSYKGKKYLAVYGGYDAKDLNYDLNM